MKWYHSVKIKLIGFFLLVSMVFLVTMVIIFSFIREESLRATAPEKASAATAEILRKITNVQTNMEDFVLRLASVGKEDIKNIHTLKAMFTADNESILVSGGIWFEPYAKHKDVKDYRHFFNRNADNTFTEVSDYLQENPQDYRKMEFYLSAKHLKKGETSWTKVYNDPVTNVRMITVVTPIYKNNVFIGVASVDLEIERQKYSLFDGTMKAANSYFIMIDIEGTVIGKSTRFKNIIDHDENIYDLNNTKTFRLIQHIKPALDSSITIENIDDNSTLKSHVYFVENDPILGLDSMVAVYHFPFTHWKVVIGISEDEVLADNNKTYKQITIATIILTLLAALFGYFLLRKAFINPMEDINEQLKEKHTESAEIYNMLTCDDKGEIGVLVQNFNNRTSSLKESREREAIEIQKRIDNEKLLVQQSKMAAMGEMMDAVAHQWKQPLNALSMYSEILKSDFDEGEVDEKYVTQFSVDIQVQIEHMVSTLDEFRNFFRPNEKATDFQLLDVINSVLFLTKDEFLKHRITVNIEREDSITLHGSANEFKHLILNLLSNAKDAFNDNNIEKRVINIRLMHQEESDILEVEDNAGGIPEEVIRDIFKANVTTKEKGKGTGIGLYMSTQIAQKHHAILSVHNQNDGACFVVAFKK